MFSVAPVYRDGDENVGEDGGNLCDQLLNDITPARQWRGTGLNLQLRGL
jgi:hypothetical protein